MTVFDALVNVGLTAFAMSLAFCLGKFGIRLRAPKLQLPNPLPTSGFTQYESPDAALALISSARIYRIGSHDHVQLWNRGGLGGAMIMSAGDGHELATRLGLSLVRAREADQ